MQPRFIEDLLKEAIATLDLAKRINQDTDRKLLQAQRLKDEATEIFNTSIQISNRSKKKNFYTLIFATLTLAISVLQYFRK